MSAPPAKPTHARIRTGTLNKFAEHTKQAMRDLVAAGRMHPDDYADWQREFDVMLAATDAKAKPTADDRALAYKGTSTIYDCYLAIMQQQAKSGKITRKRLFEITENLKAEQQALARALFADRAHDPKQPGLFAS